MIIDWTDPTLADLAALHAYISDDDSAAAAEMLRRIVDVVESRLPRMPQSGGRVACRKRVSS